MENTEISFLVSERIDYQTGRMGKKKGKKDQLYPEGNWQAKISYSTGTYLRLADQVSPVQAFFPLQVPC